MFHLVRARAAFVIITSLFVSGLRAAPIPIANIKRADAVVFEKDILPILRRSCLACHNASDKQGELVLESPEAMRKGGDSGPAIVSGKGAESLLLILAAHQDEPAMPPPGNDVNAKPLTSQELGLLRLWIDQGARGTGGVAMLSPKRWQKLPSTISPIYSIALTPDGQYLAASRANQLFLYHVPTGRMVTNLSDAALVDAGSESQPGFAHRDLIQSVAFSIDGDLLASGSFREVKLWRRPSDVQTLSLATGGPVGSVAVSPDRNWIATTGANNGVRLWNATDGKPGPTMAAHTDKVTALKFTADSNRLISASLDQSIRLWNTADGTPAGVVETGGAVHAVELVAAAVASEQQPVPPQLIVSGGADKFVRTWTVPTAAPVKLTTALANVQQLVSSTDGRFIAMTVADGTVRVIGAAEESAEPNAFKTIAEWKSDTGPIVSLAFIDVVSEKPQEAAVPHLVTSAADGSVSTWSVPDRKLIDRWRGGAASVTALAATADGKVLASGSENGSISLWNMATEPIQNFDAPAGTTLAAMALSPSRSLAAAAGTVGGKPVVVVRNLDDSKTTHTLAGHSGAIRSIAFSQDNARIISGSDDQTARVWNLANAAQPEQFKLEGHPAAVTAVALSKDGTQVLVGTANNAVRLWKLADKPTHVECPGHGGAIVGVGFDAANQPFSVSKDRTVRFWNPADGKQLRTFNVAATTVASARSADGQQIAVAGDDKQLRTYQLSNGQLLKTLAGHAAPALSMEFSADGKQLVSTAPPAANSPGETILWNIELNPPRLLESFRHPDMAAAAFSKQAGRLVVGHRGGKLAVRSSRFLRHVDGNQQPITALAFHPNGQTLFTTARDGAFRGYTVSNGQQAFATTHGAAINDLALTKDGQALATAGENGVVRLWQANGAVLAPQQLTGLPGPAKSVAFSDDGQKVLAGAAGQKPAVLVFDRQTGVMQQRFSAHAQPAIALLAGRAGPDAPGYVLSASADGLWQWNIHALRNIPGHSQTVTSLAAPPTAPMQVFSGSLDSTIRHWNLTNGQLVRQFNHGGPVVGIDVRGDGQRMASASENRTAKLWNINGQQIAEMRGDVRRKTRVARLTQQQTAATARVTIAKQQLDAGEKDVPTKTAAGKKAAETLAAANKDVQAKTTALQTAQAAKVAAEKTAIEASTAARKALLAKAASEAAAKNAAAEVPISQQRAAQLVAAAGAAPTDAALKKAATDAQQAVTAAQQKSQQLQKAVQPPTQAAQAAINTANQATQKVTLVQKPYNDALAALRTAQSAQNLASQQQAIAARELKAAQAHVPVVKAAHVKSEAALAEVKKLLEAATKESTEADQAIRSVAFSPDGRLLATAGDFGNVHTWDSETGAALAAFSGHTAALSAVAFLDDAHIISGSADQSTRVWELNPVWRLERTIGSPQQPEIIADRVMALDFSADASRLLVGGGVPSRVGELHVFNVADGTRTLFLPQAHDDVVYAAKFSPDGKRIASAGADKYLRTFDIASAQQLRRFEGHTGYVLGVAWKSDGQSLVSASADTSMKIWNSETGDQRRTITNNILKHVTAVRYIGSTDNIVSCCGDRTVRMHTASNGGNFRNFAGAATWLHCVDITPDSSILAAGTASGTVHLWNGANGQQLKTLVVGQVPGAE